MATHTITVEDWHPIFLNESLRMHWAVYQKELRAAAQRLGEEKLVALCPDAKRKRVCTVTFHGWGHGGPFPDPDNAWKILRDAMKLAYVIKDDNEKFARFNDPVFVRSHDKKTVIVVEDA